MQGFHCQFAKHFHSEGHEYEELLNFHHSHNSIHNNKIMYSWHRLCYNFDVVILTTLGSFRRLFSQVCQMPIMFLFFLFDSFVIIFFYWHTRQLTQIDSKVEPNCSHRFLAKYIEQNNNRNCSFSSIAFEKISLHHMCTTFLLWL